VRADEFENRLLKQYKKQRVGEAQKLKREVAEALAQADAQHSASPKTVKALQSGLARLREDDQLPGVERAALIRQVQERLLALAPPPAEKAPPQATEKASQIARPTLRHSWRDEDPRPVSRPREYAKSYERPPASWPREQARSSWAPQGPTQDMGAGAPLSLGVTPVVSADRRFVRVNISGTFNFFQPGPWTVIQIPVPTLLYGSNGPVAVRPIKIMQIMLP
jgi:hypothetical protein